MLAAPGHGVEVQTTGDPNFPQDLSQKLVETCQTVYPKIKDYFNPAAPESITFKFDENYDGVAYRSGPMIVFSSKYMIDHPKDIDVVTHEVTHIIQAYPKYDPSWLVEGIADFSRFEFGVDNSGAGWSLPEFDPSQKYTDSYRIAARFLAWLDNRFNGIVQKLDTEMRASTFNNDETWRAITGKTVDELWNDYASNPGL